MRVFLTGGTGFVGNEILRQLLEAGHSPRVLVRPGSESKLSWSEGIEVRQGDVLDPESLDGALAGCEAVIHLVGIIREFPGRGVTFEKLHHEATANMVHAAQTQGVRRFLQMSANGTRPEAESPYHRTKWRAEEEVRSSGLAWTIFRPSLIFGPEDEFVNMLADMIRKLPVMPVIGDGDYKMTPVAVEDVAAGFLGALARPETAGQTYPCCGPEDFSYDELLDEIGRAIGKEKVPKLHQPVFLVKPFVSILESIPQFPLTKAQMTMLLEGNVCDPRPWTEAFDLKPCPFREGIRNYLSP